MHLIPGHKTTRSRGPANSSSVSSTRDQESGHLISSGPAPIARYSRKETGAQVHPSNPAAIGTQNRIAIVGEPSLFDDTPPTPFPTSRLEPSFGHSAGSNYVGSSPSRRAIFDEAYFPHDQRFSGMPTPPYDFTPLPATPPTQNPNHPPAWSPLIETMTPGQVDLFSALFSLARPGDEYYNPALRVQFSDTTDVPPSESARGSEIVSSKNKFREHDDTEGIKSLMVKTLTLDPNVKSNSLPFVLECYALWVSKMMFQPLRIVTVGREYVLRHYARSDSARRKLTLVSTFARLIARDTTRIGDDLTSFGTFRSIMFHDYTMANSNATADTIQTTNSQNTSCFFDYSYELLSMSFKVLPISAILSTMQLAAPIFRRACPDPPQALVHLPTLLLNLDVSLRYYCTLDVLLSVITNRPMFFRYNVDFTAQFPESKLRITSFLGIQWLYGTPDRLVVTLARINAIREDLGTCLDQRFIRELEYEIGHFESLIGESSASDPKLTAARFTVQECWRQAAYIYLYMGLCGADTEDARVVTAHYSFMKLFKETEPARHPDVFLILPVIMLGMTTVNEEDRIMIKKRMRNLPECMRPGTLGNEVLQMLDDIWTRTTIQKRRKKCDEGRPTCKRCSRAGIDCTGYPSTGNLGRNAVEARPKHARNTARAAPGSIGGQWQEVDHFAPLTTEDLALVPPIEIPNIGASTQLDATNFPLTAQSSSDSAVSAVTSGSAVPTLFSETWSDISFIGPSAAAIESLYPSPHSPTYAPIVPYTQPPTARVMAAPYDPLEHPDAEPDLAPPAASRASNSQLMTPGQASLFSALFSLAQPGDNLDSTPAPVPERTRIIHQGLASPVSDRGGSDWCPPPDDDGDTEGIRDIFLRSLPLDRNVKSNTLPYILECYALWIRRMIFQPLRVAAIGREYALRKFQVSEAAREKLMLVSHFARAVAWDTTYDSDNIPALTSFRRIMSEGYMVARSSRDASGRLDLVHSQVALENSYELISISCKLLPLSTVLSTMEMVAPVFRRACPDPPEALVHLPSLLLHLDISLRYYSTVDVLLSVLSNRPMFFRYNVEFTDDFPESKLFIENHLGLQWLYGVPDRLVVTLARINALREDLGICTDVKIIKELETEIGRFKPIIAASISSDPVLTVARLVVQECWRQAAFIYLYMGLCGANSEDARVLAANKKFMQLFKDTRPARHPDAFLILPMTILGIATRNTQDRAMIKRRLFNIPDCSRRRTLGHEVILMLEDIWTHTARLGRPAIWSDLRLACLRVTGV